MKSTHLKQEVKDDISEHVFNPKETEPDLDEVDQTPYELDEVQLQVQTLDPNMLHTPPAITESIRSAEMTYFEKLCKVRVSQFGHNSAMSETTGVSACATSMDSINFALSTVKGTLLLFTSADLKLRGVSLPGKAYTSMELSQDDTIVCHSSL